MRGPVAQPTADLREHATLAIGCFASICRDRLADRLLVFARAWPRVDLGVHDKPERELIAGVRDGSLALAVLPGGPRDGLSSARLWHEEVMVALAPDHPLAATTSVSATALHKERLLIARQDHGAELHRFLAHQVAPSTPLAGVLCNTGWPGLLGQVATGQGVALVLASHAGNFDQRLVVIPVSAARARFPVSAYWRSASADTPLATLIASFGATEGR